MKTELLKAKILDLLIKGELTAKWREDHKNIETADVLLEKIRSEKEKLLNDELLAKGKKTLVNIKLRETNKNDEPYEIPISWKWCHLEDICLEIKRGKSPVYTEKSNYLVFAQKCNLKEGGIGLYKALYLDESQLQKYPKTEFMKKGDVVINSTGTGTLGRIGFYNEDLPEGILGIVPDGHVTKISPLGGINGLYIYSYLKTKQPEIELQGSGSTNQKELKPQTVKDIYIPIPPLEEQKEIARIAEKLLTLADDINVSYSNLEELSKKAKAKILDLLIKGELTSKWRDEHKDIEAADVLLEKIRSEKEKKLNDDLIKKRKKPTAKVEIKEVFKNDEPFEIPTSWKWCRLEDLCYQIKRGKSPVYTEKSKYLVFAQKCNLKEGGIGLNKALYLDESQLQKYPEEEFMKKGDVVINSTGTGTLGRIGYFNEDLPEGILGLVPDGHVTKISAIGNVNGLFIYSYLKTKQSEIELLGSGSTNQKELKPQTIKEIYIPLPPIEEQKEIARIAEKLRNQIDSLTNINTTQSGDDEDE